MMANILHTKTRLLNGLLKAEVFLKVKYEYKAALGNKEIMIIPICKRSFRRFFIDELYKLGG